MEKKKLFDNEISCDHPTDYKEVEGGEELTFCCNPFREINPAKEKLNKELKKWFDKYSIPYKQYDDQLDATNLLMKKRRKMNCNDKTRW